MRRGAARAGELSKAPFVFISETVMSVARVPSRFFVINNCCSPSVLSLIYLSAVPFGRNNYKNVSLAMRSRLVTCIINEISLNACSSADRSYPFLRSPSLRLFFSLLLLLSSTILTATFFLVFGNFIILVHTSLRASTREDERKSEISISRKSKA